jgi:hypothetical protein
MLREAPRAGLAALARRGAVADTGADLLRRLILAEGAIESLAERSVRSLPRFGFLLAARTRDTEFRAGDNFPFQCGATTMSHLDEYATTDPPAPSPASYRALRMAAEWASAVRGQQLNFAYDAGTGHMVLDRSGVGGTLPVLTRASARRPLVLGVEIEVPGAPPLTISGDQASALFWSESAVEKFLLSYYASAAADDAPRFLERLFDAWYGYPAELVQVCAIAYLCGRVPPPDGTQLSLSRTVGLVCLEGGSRLRLLTLDEFASRYATGLQRPGAGIGATNSEQPQARAGWPITEGVESIVARDVAEFVSGMRGHFVAFSLNGTTLVPEVYAGPEPLQELPPATVFTALARPVRPDRPRPARLAVWVQERGPDARVTPQTLIPGRDDPSPEFLPDSLFWTEGSVEKLLVPYYASVKGGDAWFFTGCLMSQWEGLLPPGSSSVDEVARAFTARLRRFRTAADPAPEPAPTGESTVYAVMHLPRSEYADDAEVVAEDVAEDVAATILLTVNGGQPSYHPLWRSQRGGVGGAR